MDVPAGVPRVYESRLPNVQFQVNWGRRNPELTARPRHLTLAGQRDYEAREMIVRRIAMGFDDQLRGVLDEVQRVGGWMWDRGWAESNAGNVSVDVTELLSGADEEEGVFGQPWTGTERIVPYEIPDASLAGRWLLVSATGARFRDVARERGRGLLLLRIADDLRGYGVVWSGGDDSAYGTSELVSHLLIHAEMLAQGRGYRAVLHTHPTHLMALNQMPRGADAAWLNRALWSMVPEVRLYVADGVGVAPYHLPGSRALADATAEVVHRHRVAVWDRHGCVAVERDVVHAFDLIDTLDKAAHIYLMCQATGATPRGLCEDELDELGRLAERLGLVP